MKPISRLDDEHICPVHGPNVIVQVATRSQCDARPIAPVGDKTACGAVIMSGTDAMKVDGRRVATIGSETSHGGTDRRGLWAIYRLDAALDLLSVHDKKLRRRSCHCMTSADMAGL